MGEKIIEYSDLTCIGKGYEFYFLFFGCQKLGARVVPAIVSLIPSVFTKSFPLLSPWCWVDDYKRLRRCRSGNRPWLDCRGFLKSEKHFLFQLQIHNDQAHQSKTDIAILVDLKDISLLVGMGAGVGGVIAYRSTRDICPIIAYNGTNIVSSFAPIVVEGYSWRIIWLYSIQRI